MTTTPDPGDSPDPNESPSPTGPTPPAPPIYAPGDPAAYPPPGPVGYTPPGPSPWVTPTPPPAPMGYAPPPPMPKKKTNWVAIGVLIGIVVLIGGGFYLFRDRLSGSVNDLAVGDCFDEPAVTTSVTDVQHQPCTSPHDGEVFLLVNDSTSGTYPGVDHFRDLARDQCLPAASTYLATDFNARPDLDAGYFYPTSESWDGGDRGLTCYLYRVDSQPLNASVKNIGTAPLP